MVALYDYDPRESSPNVDVEVSPIVKETILLLFNHFKYLTFKNANFAFLKWNLCILE